MNNYPHVVYRKHSFLSALAMGLSAFAITVIISCTGVIIYGMHFAGNQSEKLVYLVEEAVRGLPELQKSLPPVLADILDDRRQPDYRENLEITANVFLIPDRHGRVRTAVQVVNNGREVVSLLSLRVIVLNENNEIISESNEWAATPFAADDDWRGPLMPGSRRRFTSSYGRAVPFSSVNDLRTEVEVTDIRIWNGGINTAVDSISESGGISFSDL